MNIPTFFKKRTLKRSIFLLCFLISTFGVIAQLESQGNQNFFFDLAIRDASYEISLKAFDLDDEEDFWLDQSMFEKLLLKKSKEEYQSYINAKNFAYQRHLDNCSDSCMHGKFYYRQATIYVSKATLAPPEIDNQKQISSVVDNFE